MKKKRKYDKTYNAKEDMTCGFPVKPIVFSRQNLKSARGANVDESLARRFGVVALKKPRYNPCGY